MKGFRILPRIVLFSLMAAMAIGQSGAATPMRDAASVAATKEAAALLAAPALVLPRRPDGGGDVSISGELKQWHKVTLTLDGPFAYERDRAPNPFTDYRMDVTFTHESGAPAYRVPGYFAADGDAANTSADSGVKWRAHLAPDKTGAWTYMVSFRKGKGIAVRDGAAVDGDDGAALKPFDGRTGQFTIAPTDKTGRDFRARGRLEYAGKHYLRFSGSGEYFLKAGADSPETLLAYADFDDTVARKEKAPLKTWGPHVKDWKAGDPAWKDGKGKGLIGALNYLAGKGVNSFSFLTYNAGGDGDNVWPFVERDAKLHYDCSKLDQWGVVFDHATALGLHLHFKMQETENDDNRRGAQRTAVVPESLDGGALGPERRLYCRELIARFGHNLALNWNIGEENTQSSQEVRDMARTLRETDSCRRNIVIHTFPSQQDTVYPPLLGGQSELTGASLQNSWSQAHPRVLKWVNESDKAGKPWVVANDEQGPASAGVPPDFGYEGFSGEASGVNVPRAGAGAQKGGAAAGAAATTDTVTGGGKPYTLHDVRKLCLWGALTAGGAGVEYYFGYKLPQNDLVCEDFRSRDKSWDYCRHALAFFRDNAVPFWEMQNADALAGNPDHDNSRFCFARPGALYVVYLPNGGAAELDLRAASGVFSVRWFNPRDGGPLVEGPVRQVVGGASVSLGQPPADPDEDWTALVHKK